jgi:HD-GYP domain-containing protein (c-di-GMP phosphodiesterase class II)
LLPPELVDRPAKISDAERNELVGAMVRTIRALIGAGRITDSVVRRVLVAYEHHHPYLDPATQEPARLHVFSRIVAVADAYDALTTHRPWRAGFSPDEALRMLSKEAGTRFDPMIVRVLVNVMGLYPLGTVVVLDTGEVAVVYHNSNDPRLFEKPWVKVVKDAQGQLVKRTLIRNLAEHEGPGGVITGRPTPEMLAGVDVTNTLVL